MCRTMQNKVTYIYLDTEEREPENLLAQFYELNMYAMPFIFYCLVIYLLFNLSKYKKIHKSLHRWEYFNFFVYFLP